MSDITSVSIPESPLGGNIRRLREFRKLNAIELADLIGLSGSDQTKRVGISNYESGRRKPSKPVIQALANALDITVHDLCNTVISISTIPWEDGLATVLDKIPIRPDNAGSSSIPRTAPMPPSKAKHVRQAKAALLASRDRLASALDGMEAQLVRQTLKDVLAAVDELDKLMQGE